MSAWRVLLTWIRRSDVSPHTVMRTLASAVLTQMASNALTIGAPLLLVLAWSHAGRDNVLRDIAIPLVIIEILAFLRSPLRYLDRMSSHRLGVGSVTHWRRWLTTQVSRWSFRSMSGTSRSELLSQSVNDVEFLQGLWLRVIVPALATLVSFVVTAAIAITVAFASHASSTSTLLLIGLTAGSGAMAMVIAQQLSPMVQRLAALHRTHADAVEDIHGRQILAQELALLRVSTSNQVQTAPPSLVRWRQELARHEQWWHRLDSGLVVISGLLVVAATALAHSNVDPQLGTVDTLVASGLLAITFASLSGELLGSWRLALEAGAQVVVTATALDERGHIETGVNSGHLKWPESVTSLAIPNVAQWKPGALIAVVGPSGSGKSTWLREVALLDIGAASLYVNGVTLAELDENELRRHVQHVATEPEFLGTRLFDELTLGRATQVDVDALLRDLSLSTNPSLRPSQCSRGERHRYAIARALVGRPDVILIDEPTAGLGDDERQRVVRIFRERGVTAIMVTHDPALISECDQVIALSDITG